MHNAKTVKSTNAVLAAAALIFAAGTAQAQTSYVFTAIDTTRHGIDVVNGENEKAIARIRKDDVVDFSFSESTNLCIAYTRIADRANARKSCDRAVDIARKENGMRAAFRKDGLFNVGRRDLDLVIALSNRSVAHAANGQYDRALEDLREAETLSPTLSAVPNNLAMLSKVSTR